MTPPPGDHGRALAPSSWSFTPAEPRGLTGVHDLARWPAPPSPTTRARTQRAPRACSAASRQGHRGRTQTVSRTFHRIGERHLGRARATSSSSSSSEVEAQSLGIDAFTVGDPRQGDRTPWLAPRRPTTGRCRRPPGRAARTCSAMPRSPSPIDHDEGASATPRRLGTASAVPVALGVDLPGHGGAACLRPGYAHDAGQGVPLKSRRLRRGEHLADVTPFVVLRALGVPGCHRDHRPGPPSSAPPSAR